MKSLGRIYDMGLVDIQRIALLTNPTAVGSHGAVHRAAIARQRFNDAGIDVLSIQGKDVESSKQLAAEMIAHPDIDALVLCGGDGLANCCPGNPSQLPQAIGLDPCRYRK
ncbi:diacylglycerol kinase family protein [Corynebacterium epidermidicanis]|uniref:diacylglycerol kinase family protein n=1 Tax=Corynebacterium epidermidicanis TaxID=1050174 RepID=UPI001187534A|nr:diacylglycerol kinase family protein [Corynebacterium epidermidicanis]